MIWCWQRKCWRNVARNPNWTLLRIPPVKIPAVTSVSGRGLIGHRSWFVGHLWTRDNLTSKNHQSLPITLYIPACDRFDRKTFRNIYFICSICLCLIDRYQFLHGLHWREEKKSDWPQTGSVLRLTDQAVPPLPPGLAYVSLGVPPPPGVYDS